jgi:hypothetical protein
MGQCLTSDGILQDTEYVTRAFSGMPSTLGAQHDAVLPAWLAYTLPTLPASLH